MTPQPVAMLSLQAVGGPVARRGRGQGTEKSPARPLGRRRDPSYIPRMSEPSTDFRVSEKAAKRIQALAEAEGVAGTRLRVTVSGGGCSGFQYGFDLDAAVNDDDRVIQAGAAEVVIDEVSLPFVAGAELDYVEELVGSYFAVKNPNASSTCGCGVSFSL
jgi:iron-sulfur cluster insertion protein